MEKDSSACVHFRGTAQKLLALWVVLVACPLAIRADTAYSTFGPSHAFGSGGYTVEDGLGWAAPFQPAVSGTLESIDLPLAVQSATPMSMRVVIATDASGSPGTALESFTVSGLTTTPTVETATSALHPFLTAGSSYWFEVIGQGSNPGSDIGQWYDNGHGLTETVDMSSNGGATWSVFSSGEPDPAFDVISTVPEPAALAIIGTGLTVEILSRRRVRENA